MAAGCWRKEGVRLPLGGRGAFRVGASVRELAGMNTRPGIFVCFVFVEMVYTEVFFTPVFCAHYLAIPLLYIKFRMISLVLRISRLPEAQQRVGGCFLSLMPQMKTLYLAYCANHPSAVNVLTEHRYTPGDTLP